MATTRLLPTRLRQSWMQAYTTFGTRTTQASMPTCSGRRQTVAARTCSSSNTRLLRMATTLLVGNVSRHSDGAVWTRLRILSMLSRIRTVARYMSQVLLASWHVIKTATRQQDSSLRFSTQPIRLPIVTRVLRLTFCTTVRKCMVLQSRLLLLQAVATLV